VTVLLRGAAHPIARVGRWASQAGRVASGDTERNDRMLKVIGSLTLASACILSAMPAEAKVCRNSHGRYFRCHKVVAPRVNLKSKKPVKVVRCRGQHGRFNKC
jgi:hypothetical protein